MDGKHRLWVWVREAGKRKIAVKKGNIRFREFLPVLRKIK